MTENAVVSIAKNPGHPNAARITKMVNEAVTLLGGMENIVRPGDMVVIKGNFSAPYPPPYTVDRRVAAAVIALVRRAGASRVVLCDSFGASMGHKTTTSTIDELCIRETAKAAGGELLSLDDDSRIRLQVPGGKSLDMIDYPESMYYCDVLINLSCMKTNAMTMVNLGLHNYQGIVNNQKHCAHRDELDQKMVDIQKIRPTQLTIIDALTAMEGDGEQGNPRSMNMIIASQDPVAADAIAAYCMGIDDVLDVTAIRLAQYEGIGIADLNKITVRGFPLDYAREKFKLPSSYTKPQDRYLTGVYPNIGVQIGGACRQCWLMAGEFAAELGNIKHRQFNLIAGVDPKLPGPIEDDLDGVIVLGDCACAAAGMIKETRSRMLLESQGLLVPGCPPCRPARMMLEEYLEKRNLVDKDQRAIAAETVTKKVYDYYKGLDPTWKPKSQRWGII